MHGKRKHTSAGPPVMMMMMMDETRGGKRKEHEPTVVSRRALQESFDPHRVGMPFIGWLRVAVLGN